MHRFFAPSLDAGDETVALPRDEAEHLTRVLRIAAGDDVAVFDGRGREYLARVIGAVRRDVRVQLLSRIEPAPELPVSVTLAQAILKGDKMDEVVRDAVMLGVAAIQPLVTRRTESTIAAILRGARLDRWRRIALASVKQSRRAVLPEIRTPLAFETYLDEPPAAMRLMLVEPGIEAEAQSLAALRGVAAPRCLDHRRSRRRVGRTGVGRRKGERRRVDLARPSHAQGGCRADCGAERVELPVGRRVLAPEFKD